jgi:hypothetical protein
LSEFRSSATANSSLAISRMFGGRRVRVGSQVFDRLQLLGYVFGGPRQPGGREIDKGQLDHGEDDDDHKAALKDVGQLDREVDRSELVVTP